MPVPTSGSNPTYTALSPATHSIGVGDGDHKFRPEITYASVGDILAFHFHPTNHSVARAEWKVPCRPIESNPKGRMGFFSGFHPLDGDFRDEATRPVYIVRINDTDPIWVYCAATDSCKKYQMVAVIYPITYRQEDAEAALNEQKQIAQNVAFELKPGETVPPESPPWTSVLDVPITPSTTTSATASGSANLESHHTLSTGAIVGIIVAGIIILALAAALFFFIGRSKTLKQEMSRHSITSKYTDPRLNPHDQYQMFAASPNERFSAISPQTAASLDGSIDSRARKGFEHNGPPVELGNDEFTRTAMPDPASEGRSSLAVSGISENYPSVVFLSPPPIFGPSAPRGSDGQKGRYLV